MTNNIVRIVLPAGGCFLSQEGRPHHRHCTARAALDSYRIEGTIHLTGAAFHTRQRMSHAHRMAGLFEDAVRADVTANTTTGALVRVEIEGIRTISVVHRNLSCLDKE